MDQSDASFNIGESGFTQGWPSTADDVASIYLQAKDLDNSIFYPNAGVEFKIDLNPPALSTVIIASNNSTNNLYAKTGDQISITITGDEKLLGDHDHDWAGDGITYTGFNCSFSSIAATVSTGDGNVGYVWSVYDDVTVNHTEGETLFALNYKDLAGNTGETISQASPVFTATNITIDNTVPAISSGYPTIVSNNAETNYAKVNDNAVLDLSFNDVLNGPPTVSIAGATGDVAIPITGASATYQATRTMPTGTANDAAYSPAQIGVIVSNILDRAGNAGTNITNNNFTNYIIFDETAPTLAGTTTDLVISEVVNFDDDTNT